MESTIKINSLVKEYKKSRSTKINALNGVSFEVGRGEIFSLLGPNGAGKTTLIKLLLGIAFPTSGDGSLLGRPLGDVATKTRIGYLPENHRYPNYLTGEQVLRYFAQLSGMNGGSIAPHINDVMNIVNMQEWRKTKIRKYSKGMLQRIGLAQAMLNSPEVIFLDEPTDGVDPIGRKEIRQSLVKLKEQGKTIFLNSHLLSEVELISDRVAIMNKGTILRIGTVADLTDTKHEYIIKVAGEAQAAAGNVTNLASVVSSEKDQIVLRVDSVQQLNQVIDALRKAAVDISEIAPRRESLEEAFMTLIQKVD
ncbi:MAG TPA: ABC transporter ATP-binding protein [Candidatus Kapabacteria bacterium]|nr:ABC transporter ATP-binding protein [Candidatus Kapabacteria bacterium]